MQKRTDLALEQREMLTSLPEGVECEETQKGDAVITKITVKDELGASALCKPIGVYLTVEVPPFTDNLNNEELIATLRDRLVELIPQKGSALVVGLGNRDITPDALGPRRRVRFLPRDRSDPSFKGLRGLREYAAYPSLRPVLWGRRELRFSICFTPLSMK